MWSKIIKETFFFQSPLYLIVKDSSKILDETLFESNNSEKNIVLVWMIRKKIFYWDYRAIFDKLDKK